MLVIGAKASAPPRRPANATAFSCSRCGDGVCGRVRAGGRGAAGGGVGRGATRMLCWRWDGRAGRSWILRGARGVEEDFDAAHHLFTLPIMAWQSPALEITGSSAKGAAPLALAEIISRRSEKVPTDRESAGAGARGVARGRRSVQLYGDAATCRASRGPGRARGRARGASASRGERGRSTRDMRRARHGRDAARARATRCIKIRCIDIRTRQLAPALPTLLYPPKSRNPGSHTRSRNSYSYSCRALVATPSE